MAAAVPHLKTIRAEDNIRSRLATLRRTTLLALVLKALAVLAALASQIVLARCMRLDAFGL